MTVALEAVLAKAGLRVDADEFLRLVEDTARRVSVPHPEPAEHFSAEQQEALAEVGLDLSPYADDEPCPRAKSVVAHAVFTKSAYSVSEAARLLDLTQSEVRDRLRQRKLFGWKDSEWHLPAWQFTEGGPLPGLRSVIPAIPPDQPPMVVAAFMNTQQPDLEINGQRVTPREWLLAHGDPKSVANLVTSIGTAA
ncbi:DNA-binding protein [Haloechinothrix sp. LS1_15]|uniref:DNA-binding protein n=1 Tax=Haloechinothrix sp. LS1_15 TaxID=2652248 RepID=UPI00294827BD|nr:DNA-binding protein [Haloechinothrix sp. LS1_15]MDV6012248.1 DNA-binding protein [Haloechinothrix sp. LS1_15]